MNDTVTVTDDGEDLRAAYAVFWVQIILGVLLAIHPMAISFWQFTHEKARGVLALALAADGISSASSNTPVVSGACMP